MFFGKKRDRSGETTSMEDTSGFLYEAFHLQNKQQDCRTFLFVLPACFQFLF